MRAICVDDERQTLQLMHGADQCLIVWTVDPDENYIEVMMQTKSLQQQFDKTHPYLP